jgi:hypothetical protein
VLDRRGQAIDPLVDAHHRQAAARQAVARSVPAAWRRAAVGRADLDRFLFEPGDVVVVVGQDGLVANVAKYLDGQPVIGVNPDPAAYEGVLVPHPAEAAADLMAAAAAGRAEVERRTMVEAEVPGGHRLRALNEVFVGHRTHQSARYRLAWREREERQSSSGVVVSTGTGATGWARSIHGSRRTALALPAPEDERLVFFTREAWPSVTTGTSLVEGELGPGEDLVLRSEMNDGGVAFGDGIERDAVELGWGVTLRVGLAAERLHLVRS